MLHYFSEKRLVYVGLQGIENAAGGFPRRGKGNPNEQNDEAARKEAERKAEEARKKKEVEDKAIAKRGELSTQVGKPPEPDKKGNDNKEAEDHKKAVKRLVNNIKPESNEDPDEVLKPYLKDIGDAFDKLKENPSKLYEYIMAHKEYTGNSGKEGWKKWNMDFCVTFGLKPKSGKEWTESEYNLYGGALQLYLYDNFKKGANPAKVFDLTKKRSTNPFMYLRDGKIGAYTVSVLTAYWNRSYSGKYKHQGKTINNLDYSNLSSEYGQQNKGRNQIIYDKAIAKLNERLKASVKAVTQKGVPGQDGKVKPQVSPGGKPQPPTSPAKKPGDTPPPVSKPTDKTGAPAGKPKDDEAKVDKQNLTEKQKKDALEMVGFASAMSVNESEAFKDIMPSLEKSYKKQVDAIYKFNNNERGPNATSYGMPIYIDFLNRESSWPAQIFFQYKALYESVDGSNSVKAAASADKFAELERAIKEYFQQVQKVQKALSAVYIKRAEGVMGKYELPDKIHSSFVDPRSEYFTKWEKFNASHGGMNKKAELAMNDFQSQQKEIVVPGLRRPKDIDDMFSVYLKPDFIPTKTPLKLDDWMQYFKGDSQAEKEKNKQTLINYLGKGDEVKAIKQLREVIKLRNMYRLRDDATKMRKEMDYDMQKALIILDYNYDNFQKYKKEKKEPEFAPYIVSQIWKS